MTKILAIEDEPTILENVVEMLKLSGYEAAGAPNGRVGVKWATEFHPDLIICDVSMPEMDGFSVLTEVRSNSATCMIPFIFLTAKVDRDAMRHGMELGADDYLTKPFTAHHLLSAVSTRLARYSEIAKSYDDRMENLRDNIVLMLPHEFRTPLTAVLGYADLYLDSSEPPDYELTRGMMGRIRSAGVRLYHLVENFQAYAQIEIIRSDPRRVERLRQMCTESAESLIDSCARNRSFDRPNDLRCNLQPAPKLAIAEEHLKKIIEELLDNAIKFSEPGTPILISGAPFEDHYTFRIQDHGRGMSDDEIARVGAYMQFERRIYEQQGSGLGLVVVQGLVELHGGSMEIKSVLHEQTEVSVRLPLCPTQQ